MEEQQNLFELQIDAESQTALTDGAKWAKFLSIVGFIACGIMLIAGIAVGMLMGSTPTGEVMPYGGFLKVGVTLIYIILSGVYFFPCLFLFRYATRIKDGIATSDTGVVSNGFQHLKMLFKYMGILMIIGLVLTAIFVVIAMASAAMTTRY